MVINKLYLVVLMEPPLRNAPFYLKLPLKMLKNIARWMLGLVGLVVYRLADCSIHLTEIWSC